MSRTTLNKKISRLMAVLLCLMLLLSSAPTAYAAEGSCGDNLTWSFDGTTLTISGIGAMKDYSEKNLAPWYHFRQDIQNLSLPEGLTRVGNMAFYDCVNISSVVLPSTVKELGELAFCQNRSMTMLSLNQGLLSIGRCAFDRCESLLDLRIPNTVTTIGEEAFYMCTSLTYVTIPASVTSMGSGVFAYCDSLICAEVEASVEKLPFWTFYGCDNLNTASFGDAALDTNYLKTETSVENEKAPAQSQTQPQAQPQTQPQTQPQVQPQTQSQVQTQPQESPNQNADDNIIGSVDILETEDGSTRVESSITNQTDGSTIIVKENITVNPDATDHSVDTSITATVVSPEGWNEVVDKIQSVQGEQSDTQQPTTSQKLDVNVYAPADNTVPKKTLQDLAGSKVNLTINTQSGSKFMIDCETLEKNRITSDLNLSYTIELAESVPDDLNGLIVYKLVFTNSSAINAEVMIRLPLENVKKAASLYQIVKDEPQLLQSVVVDTKGYAHFYLAAVDSDYTYLIAMNVSREQQAQALIPDVMSEEYRLVDQATGKEYVVTGRTSSWNMGLGKVMGILAGVMIGVVVLVGVIMFLWNKQRLKAGYVPQWDDDDDYN